MEKMKNKMGGSRKWFLYCIVGSIIAGALLGILIVLRNEWSWFEIRVLLTTLIVAAASLCGLICDFMRVPGGRNLLANVGLGLCLVATLMLLGETWTGYHGELYWKVTTVLCTFEIAIVHACLLGLASLSKRFKWVMLVAYQTIFGLAGLLSYLILSLSNSEGLVRLTVVLAIVNTALTLVIPILHRISKSELPHGETITLIQQKDLFAIDEEIGRLRDRIADLERARSALQR